MPDALLRIDVLAPGLVAAAYILAGLTLVGLSLRRQAGWTHRALGWGTVGAVTGGALLWLVEGPVNAIGTPLLWSTRWSVVVLFLCWGLVGANLLRSRARRKAYAAGSAAVLLVCAGVVVNAQYALNPTLGAVFGIVTSPPLSLPPLVPRSPVPTGSITDPTGGSDPSHLGDTWRAPPGMARQGVVGSVVIPGTVSGFAARPAGIYLPPAALTVSPPPLPFLLLMMGQPGNPDPSYIAAALDRYAHQHAGLAPIVVVADQLGTPWTDTLCLDTAALGRVETYINTDVAAWARTHLNIQTDRSRWTVAGYSNGGLCAISFAAKHPELWGNVLDVSGEEYPGAEHSSRTLATVFSGDRAAYAGAWPAAVLGRHRYVDMLAIFTAGSDDTAFKPGIERVRSAAAGAGMKTRYVQISHAGHLLSALVGGLDAGLGALYPRLGLSKTS